LSKFEESGNSINRFDDWATHEYSSGGAFTALVILVGIGGLSITPLRSTWFHVTGDEFTWAEIARLLGSSGAAWDGVMFTVLRDAHRSGPVADIVARGKVAELVDRIREDRSVINAHHFFDNLGRRLMVEEVAPQ